MMIIIILINNITNNNYIVVITVYNRTVLHHYVISQCNKYVNVRTLCVCILLVDIYYFTLCESSVMLM